MCLTKSLYVQTIFQAIKNNERSIGGHRWKREGSIIWQCVLISLGSTFYWRGACMRSVYTFFYGIGVDVVMWRGLIYWAWVNLVSGGVSRVVWGRRKIVIDGGFV